MENPWFATVYKTNIDINSLEIMHGVPGSYLRSTCVDFQLLIAFWHDSTNSQYADKCTM